MKGIWKWLALICVAAMLAGCGKGLDAKLSTESEETIKKSAEIALKDMTEEQRVVAAWAFSNLTAEDDDKYKDATIREIINGVADSKINSITQELNELEKNRVASEKVRDEILKVDASDSTYRLGANFFGDQTNIYVTITNNSNLAFSSLTWKAKLFLNQSTEPVAEANILDSYTYNDDGLQPGEAQKREFSIGGLGSSNWHTLEIKQAKSHKIELTLLPEDAKDLGNRDYLADSPLQRIDALQTELDSITSMKELIAKN